MLYNEITKKNEKRPVDSQEVGKSDKVAECMFWKFRDD